MAYTKTNWSSGDPITLAKMNNIETGILNAHTDISTNRSNITTLQTNYNTLNSNLSSAQNTIESIQRSISSTEQNSRAGQAAWALVRDAVSIASGSVENNNLVYNKTLAQRLNDDEALIYSMNTEISTARDGKTDLFTKISKIDSDISGLSGGITSINNAFSEASYSPIYGSYGSVHARLNADEEKIADHETRITNTNNEVVEARGTNGTSLNARFNKIETELTDAHSSTALNKTGANAYTTLDARFEAIESELVGQTNMSTRIDTLADNVTDLANNKINKTDIANNFTTSSAGKVLDASRGKVLKDTIDAMDAAYKAADADINESIDLINASIGLNDSAGIRKRIADLETEVNAGHDTFGDLDARFDAVEAKANNAAVATTVNASLDALDARLDAIDGGSALDTTDGTIAARVYGLETDVNTLETNLGTGFSSSNTVRTELDLKANSSDMTTALAGKASTSSVSDLTTTVNGLLDKDTIVINKPSEGSNYTNDTPNMATAQIKPNCDYLIQADNNKYYYWRYINNNWELISGAGEGGGGGTSSGTIVSSLPAVADGDENTDYFVGNNEDGYLHYRFTTIDNVKQAILIGVNPNNIKNYNVIDTTVEENGETYKYLDFYQFDYGEDTTLNSDDLPPVSQRLAHILLPQGGGGGSGTSATTRFVRIPPTSVTTIQNNDPVYIRFFYSCIDTSGDTKEASYVLKDKNGVTLTSGTLNSGASDETVSGWPQAKNDGVIYDDGYGSIDVSPYCVLGNNKFYITITTELQETFTRNWTVDILQLRLESTSSETMIVPVGNTIDISYIPFGAMQKNLNIKIDNNSPIVVSLAANINGNTQTVTIPSQTHGAHRIKMWLSAQVNGEEKTSDTLIRDYIWYEAGAEPSIILSSPMRDADKPLTISQYSEVEIPYTVYNANSNTTEVEYYYDYDASGTNTYFDKVTLVNSNSGTLTYSMNEASEKVNEQYVPHNVAIKVGTQVIIIDVVVTPLTIDISSVPGAIIDFNPATLTNNSINRLPSWTWTNPITHATESAALTVSDNFNWSSKWEGDDKDSGGGYREDEDGKCFIIRAGTYATINYKMFKQNNIQSEGITLTSSSVFDNGASMKLIFKVAAVRDASAIWFSNMGKYANGGDKEVGIQLSAHEGFLKTDQASDSANDNVALPPEYQDKVWDNTSAYAIGNIVVYKSIIYKCIKAIAAPESGQTNDWNKKAWQSLGQLETEISATNSYLYFPYSEEDKIELDININQKGNNEDFIMSYEDGVPSKAYPYNVAAGGDILYHVLDDESSIVIGSEDCDVYIYRLRIYNKSLHTNEILKNFIADGETIDERINRYQRNAIYYDSDIITDNDAERFTPYASSSAKLNPIKLAERMKDVKILMLDTPRFTTGKKDFIKGSTLRCLQAVGGKVYPGTLEKDNWYFFNGYHAGQGTTSDNYGQSARNVDFLFECDGDHAPTKPGNLSENEWKNYQSGLLEGDSATVFNTQTKSWEQAYNNQGQAIKQPDLCEDWKGTHCKISLTHNITTGANTSIPNNYFNLKTNVASSENVNNALFQKRYNDFLPYTSPAKARDNRIKNGMEFVPAILFVRERGVDLDGNTVIRQEFNDDEWHFYALGNIGDSKKTDYTRAYDPDDMNEFTVEISDNNTANSQFQSGVYLDNDTATVETSQLNIDPMSYQYPISEANWDATRDATESELAAIAKAGGDIRLPAGKTYVNHRHHTLISEPFDGDHSFEFRYACKGDYRDGDPINDTNGTIEVNGEQVSRNDLQFNINRNVWFAFYKWIITSTKEQFRAEAAQWFVPSAIEFFYAFTHYYTMMDNRAKNTFWHFAKTGQYRRVTRPVAELAHIYEVATGEVTTDVNGVCTGTFETPSSAFDPSGTYYTQYAFDLWVYDTDTACGIDNNGELSFPYGKEDRDYRVTNQPGSGWAFNGSGSIFWRRLSDPSTDGGFADEIAALMRQENDNCFSTAQHLIDEFDRFQECYPEEIWRLDIERKYIRTFTGLSYDNSVTTNKQNIRFLRAMMQGRKKYQRRQWVRNQAIYFGSKYSLNNVHTSDHTIEFNIYGPSVAPEGVPIDYTNLIVVPYQDMYIDVAVGNSTTNPDVTKLQRAKAGERVRVDCSGGSLAQETRVYIFGGEHIMALENLAPMYPYSGSFGQGKHLKALDLGSDNPNYDNPRFTSISINPNMPLLETFNVKNCNRLAQSINLSQSNNLRTVEAEGSLITGIILPNYSAIETLHLPDTVTSLTLKSAKHLDDFYIKNKSTGLVDYSKVITLNINNSDYSNNINWLDIAKETLDQSIDTLYLQNLNKSSIVNINELDDFVTKKYALETNYDSQGNLIVKLVLSGNVNVTGEWSTTEVETYQEVWPNLEFTANEQNQVTRYKIVYKYDNNTKDGAVITTRYFTPYPGTSTLTIPEVYSSVYDPSYPSIDVPTKLETREYYYVFGTINNEDVYTRYSGWRIVGSQAVLTPSTAIISLSSIDSTNTITVETVFNAQPQSYPVHWYLNQGDTDPIYVSKNNNGSVMNIEYGKSFNGHVPTVQDINMTGRYTSTVKFSGNGAYMGYKVFNGWEKAPVNLTLNEGEHAYKIYALWQTAGLDSNNNVDNTLSIDSILAQPTLTLEKLLLLSNNSERRYNSNNIGINDRFKIQMGYEGVPGGTVLTDTNPYRFNGSISPRVMNNIKPFSSSNTNGDAFTLVIDYKFDTNYTGYINNTKEAVLAGCYEKVNNSVYGFKLYFDVQNKCVRVGFGDTLDSINYSKAINSGVYSQYRNIIVLRHPKNSSTLYIYSGINNTTNDIYNDITSDGQELALSWNNVTTNAPLVFGSLVNGTIPPQMEEARGTIYWSKYWNEDLGAGECRMLAAWAHESLEFAVEDYSSQDNDNTRIFSNISGYTLPNIILTTMNSSSYIGPITKRLNETEYSVGDLVGWNNSWHQSFVNQKFFYGMPILLQSIIMKTPFYSRQMRFGSNGFDEYSTDAISYDYIFLPSYSEIATGNGSNNYRESTRRCDWINNSNVEIHVYNGSSAFNNTADSNNSRHKYMNLRFPYKAINLQEVATNTYKVRIFDNYSGNDPVYNIINSSGFTIMPGDIFVKASDNVAYIYVSAADIAAGAPIMPNTGVFTCTTGGWIRADYWWSRSTYISASNGKSSNFIYIKPNADISLDAIQMGGVISNYNDRDDDLAHTAQGACMCISFGV